MKRKTKITTAAVAAGTIGLTGVGLINASSSEATPNSVVRSVCGSNYYVVRDGVRALKTPGGSVWGHVYLGYNRSSGYNCVVTTKSAYRGISTPTLARIAVVGMGGKGYRESWGNFKNYAYVKAYGRNRCVAYWGDVSKTWAGKPHASGGRWAWGNCG
ncbi:hypothetical protein G9U51_16010 [Calidifontibacter sp. DB0510]|uniref:Uncharacterized protein n=1 Tax=Metallococcus carri TaxID=1656884 RepID=A0A967B1V3_9MICO|nr:hypothetical protein [Metallococcus carri]NHN57276.1 hypothetical protein [Metallococcus carri]NOP38119.1 hypothetical protein [Calidifontibacter sp. DB2511S]